MADGSDEKQGVPVICEVFRQAFRGLHECNLEVRERSIQSSSLVVAPPPRRCTMHPCDIDLELADKVAASGFFVVVPDYFYGDPYVPEKCAIAEWLKVHDPHKGFEETKPLIADLRRKGISSIGIAGLCCGAKVVAELAKTDDIQAAVMLHPSLVGIDDIKEVKVPIAILAAETDHISPPELIKQFEEILSSNSEVKSFVKIFLGVAHGWTVRYKTDDEAAVKSAEEAHTHMIEWFTEYVN